MVRYVVVFCIGMTIGIIGVFWYKAMEKEASTRGPSIAIEWSEEHLTLDNNSIILECKKDSDNITIKETAK